MNTPKIDGPRPRRVRVASDPPAANAPRPATVAPTGERWRDLLGLLAGQSSNGRQTLTPALRQAPGFVQEAAARLRDPDISKAKRDPTQQVMEVVASSLTSVPPALGVLFTGLVERAIEDGLAPQVDGGKIVSPSAGAVQLGSDGRAAYFRSPATSPEDGVHFSRFGEGGAEVLGLMPRASLTRPYSKDGHGALVARALPKASFFLDVSEAPRDTKWLQAFPDADRAKVTRALEGAKSSTMILNRKLTLGFDDHGHFVGSAAASRRWAAGAYEGGPWQLDRSEKVRAR